MDDAPLVIDEREALRAHFIGSDDITAALARAEQCQTDDGTEQSEKDAIVAFDAVQAGFQCATVVMFMSEDTGNR
jgi:hypothetical protein